MMVPLRRRSAAAGAALLVAGAVAGCGGVSRPDLTPSTLAPKGETVARLKVGRIVDGDTLHVSMGGDDVTVRLLGIDTPETVKPGSPVECFGPEASDFAKAALAGQTVTLEFDGSQGRTDRYGRTLAFVWIELADGGRSLFNLESVAGGYAQERQYGASPTLWQRELRAAQEQAQQEVLGRWGQC